MEALRVETIIQPNGRIVLENLPFDDGEKVEIIILETNLESVSTNDNPLKGTLLNYDDPFEPAVLATDWEVLS